MKITESDGICGRMPSPSKTYVKCSGSHCQPQNSGRFIDSLENKTKQEKKGSSTLETSTHTFTHLYAKHTSLTHTHTHTHTSLTHTHIFSFPSLSQSHIHTTLYQPRMLLTHYYIFETSFSTSRCAHSYTRMLPHFFWPYSCSKVKFPVWTKKIWEKTCAVQSVD